MVKEVSKKTATKKAADGDSSEEITTEEVKITEKVSKQVTGKKDDKKIEEPEETVEKEKVDEPEELEKPSEDDTDEAPVKGSKEVETGNENVIEEEPEERVEADVEIDKEDGDSASDATRRATVYSDDFDAVKVEKRFSMSRLLLFILIIVTSAAIFFTGMILYQSNNRDFKMPELSFLAKATPTPTEAPTPTPSPTPSIDYSDYEVEVLNGSGVSGAAGAVAGLLEEEGFENVEVGNASDQDYTDTEIQMNEDVSSEVFDAIAKVLSDYTVVEGDELDTDDDFDIIITVGQTNEEITAGEDENQ